jgi:hypothetical protein
MARRAEFGSGVVLAAVGARPADLLSPMAAASRPGLRRGRGGRPRWRTEPVRRPPQLRHQHVCPVGGIRGVVYEPSRRGEDAALGNRYRVVIRHAPVR